MAEFGRGRMLRNPLTNVSEPPGLISAARAQRQAPQNLPSSVARTSSIATALNGPVRSCAALTTMIGGTAAAKEIGDALITSNVSRDTFGADFGSGSPHPLGIAGGDDDLGAFGLCQFGSRETDAG